MYNSRWSCSENHGGEERGGRGAFRISGEVAKYGSSANNGLKMIKFVIRVKRKVFLCSIQVSSKTKETQYYIIILNNNFYSHGFTSNT